MSTKSRIPVTIITGFLGSGKTTLVNRILSESHGLRIAVIENEFGEESIDDALLVDSGESIFKMSNGCLCCSINDDLIDTLLSLLERKEEFDHVVIETTGVANPGPVIQTFIANEEIAAEYEVASVITLVDALHLGQHIDKKECIQQVALADLICLNKVDLVEADALAKTIAMIRDINKLAEIRQVERSALKFAEIFDRDQFSSAFAEEDHGCCDHNHGDHDHGSCDHDHGDHHHSHLAHEHHSSDFVSVAFKTKKPLDPAKFNAWFGQLLLKDGDSIYRAKGILKFSNRKEAKIIQAVHRIVEATDSSISMDDAFESRFVMIGENLDVEALKAGFEGCYA